MEKEQLKSWRNFFLWLFLITASVAVIIFGTTELTRESMKETLQISEQEFRRDVMNSLVILRVLLLFIILPLAITFHIMLKKKR